MKRSLWQKVLLGMVIGCLLGALVPGVGAYAKPWATIYMNMIKMIVIPTIFCAIVFGVTNANDIQTVGRISIKASWIYLMFTVVAVVLGIGVTEWLKPGVGFTLLLDSSTVSTTAVEVSLADILVNIFPSNPIAAMVEGNTLQVVFFAFMFGVAVILTGNKANDLKVVIRSLTSTIFKLVEIVVKTTPYGVVAIMAWVTDMYGYHVILKMGKLAAVIMIAFAAQYLIFGLMLQLVGLSAWQFYRKSFNIQSLAFATSSSKATISTAVIDLERNLGVSKRVADFVLPLGATINMSGSAIYIVVCALFFAQSFGMNLSIYQYLLLIITSTVGSIGAAGYPSGAVIMLGMVLPAIGLPVEGIPLIMGIDRLLDMFRTVINVTGDCAATVIVDKLEGSLDTGCYSG